MDWNFAIERWRVPLLGHVLELFAKIGLTEGVTIERVPKPLYRDVLGILRTAESAVRRLIVAAARDIVVEPKPRRPVSVKPKTSSNDESKADVGAKAKRKRRPLFGLFDPPKRVKKFFRRPVKRPPVVPRVTIIDLDYDRNGPTTSPVSSRRPRLLSWKKLTMAWSMPRLWSAASWPSWMHSKTSNAMPCGWHAGRPSLSKNAGLSAGAPCAQGDRQDSASG